MTEQHEGGSSPLASCLPPSRVCSHPCHPQLLLLCPIQTPQIPFFLLVDIGFNHTSDFPLHPGACFGVTCSSQPPRSAGEGGGERRSPAVAASHPWESVKGEKKPTSPAVLAHPSFSRDGEAVRNIRKNTFHLSQGEPGSLRGRCRGARRPPMLLALVFRWGFTSTPDPQRGDEEY